MIVSAGASRRSSVLGLNERPSTPTRAPRRRPTARPDLVDHALHLALVGRDRRLDDAGRARPPRARTPRAPACPWGSTSRRSRGPACRNLEPMRRSMPMPLATAWTSAPSASHRFAISLMNEILVARNAVRGVLDQLGRLERRSPPSASRSGTAARGSRAGCSRRACVSAPITTRSGRMNVSIAEPSRRNSGFEATSNSAPRRACSRMYRVEVARGADRRGALLHHQLVAVEVLRPRSSRPRRSRWCRRCRPRAAGCRR